MPDCLGVENCTYMACCNNNKCMGLWRNFNLSTRKKRIMKKTNGLCWLCEEEIKSVNTFSIDHKIPLSRGGNGFIENLFPSHRVCNNLKGSLIISTSKEFLSMFGDAIKHEKHKKINLPKTQLKSATLLKGNGNAYINFIKAKSENEYLTFRQHQALKNHLSLASEVNTVRIF